MYDLFQFKRLLTVSCNRNGNVRRQKLPENNCSNINAPEIQSYAFSGPSGRLLALSLTNGTILFYGLKTKSDDRPTLRQLPWFTNLSKRIATLCFDPSGSWLLCATRDATIFILPASAFMNMPIKAESPWSTEDVTEIKLSGRREVTTAVQWWKTSQGHPIAIIGNELGEISFVNLETKREVGGTYINVAIKGLELISDDTNACIYLLITSSNNCQWQLVLEQGNGTYRYPLERIDADNKTKPSPGTASSSLLSCLSVADDRLSPTIPVTGNPNQNPKRLVQYAGHTHLTAQRFHGRNYVTGHYVPNGVLTLHGADLNIVPLFTYKLPLDTQLFLLGDHLIFVVTSSKETGGRLRIISTELTSSSLDGQIEYNIESEVQSFTLPMSERFLGIVKSRSYSKRCGCILVTNKSIYGLHARTTTEEAFLQLVLEEGCYTKADRLARIFCTDEGVLYEKAAEVKLIEGQVSAAVRLYQMAKVDNSVANFAAYGHLSELLSYVRVLFTSSGLVFCPADLKHFSNVALYCYVQQSLDVQVGAVSMRQNFKEFLFENQHYDELIAIHLLATYGFYSLLSELSESRGLVPQMLEEIVPHNFRNLDEAKGFDDLKLKPCWADLKMVEILSEHGLKSLVSLETNDAFVASLLRPSLAFCLGLNIELTARHLNLVKHLLCSWKDDIDRLKALVRIYDPSNPVLLPLFRCSVRNRNISCGSVDFIDENSFTLAMDESPKSCRQLDQKIAGFFLELLLLLNRYFSPKQVFDSDLITRSDSKSSINNLKVSENERLRLPRRVVPLGTGFAHNGVVIEGKLFTWGRNSYGCLGRGPARCDSLTVESVATMKPPLLRVFSVACGASHTLILTDTGVYACGSNRFCQLGISFQLEAQKMCQPILVETLTNVEVVSVTCGQYHSLALSTDGKVYSWGWGVYGQLGHGHPRNVCIPEVIDALLDICVIRVSAGYAHSVFLSANGDVFVCGCGTFGQLGTGRTSKETVPVRIVLPDIVTLIAAGYFHNVAILTSDKIFTWGCNPQTLRMRAQVARRSRAARKALDGETRAKCMGLTNTIYDPSSSPGVFTPAEVESSEIASQIVQVSCGSSHSVLVTGDGEVYSWGRNLDGQLGHDGHKDRPFPLPIVKLNDRKVVFAACGCDYTLVLDDCGKVWGFGIDDYKQIGGAADVASSSASEGTATKAGKILTLRNRKRTVYIKQPLRCSILQPVALTTLPSIRSALSSKVILDKVSVAVAPCDALWSNLDESRFENSIVHSALEQLHKVYDAVNVERLCVSFESFQAAAKVALLDGDFSQGFSHHVKAISNDISLDNESRCRLSLHLLETYLQLISDDDTSIKEILDSFIRFWSDSSGSAQQLEDVFTRHLPQFLGPLSALVFRNSESYTDKGTDCLLSRLSSNFCMTLMSAVLDNVKAARSHSELLDLLPESIVEENLHLGVDYLHQLSSDLSVDQLWDELIQNISKDANSTSAIDLSSMDLRNLLKDELLSNGKVVLFTCGHHYHREPFMTAVLPQFEEVLNDMTSVNKKDSTAILSCYESMGFQPTACPKCFIEGLKQETV